MPKLKTHSGMKKRIKISGNGSVMKRRSANRGHILTKKTTKRKRQLRGAAYVSPSDIKQASRLLNVKKS